MTAALPATVAVTGASGFLGRHLCAALEAEGARVLRLGRGEGADRRTDYGEDSLAPALEGAEAVVHLAGRRMTREDDPLDLAPFWGPNVEAVAALVRAARRAGTGRILLASTIAVYGPASGHPYREDAAPDPTNAYGLSKLAAEGVLAMATRAEGPPSLALRLAAVYGWGEKGTPALMTFFNRAREGKPLEVRGNPGHRIDEIYVRDACAALVAALRSRATGVVNAGGGRAARLDEIARAAAATWGRPPPAITGQEAPAPDTTLDLSRARERLGWAPAWDLAAGMADFRRMAGGRG